MKVKNKSKNKPKTLSEWAFYFLNLPETLRPKTQFEGQDKPEKLPDRPTDNWLRIAGSGIHRLLRKQHFNEYKQELQSAYDKGGDLQLWKEFIKILHAQADLNYPTDYLHNFSEHCQLVANAIEDMYKMKWDDPNGIEASQAKEQLKIEYKLERSLSWFNQLAKNNKIRSANRGQRLKIHWPDLQKHIEEKGLSNRRLLKEIYKKTHEDILNKIINPI